tara:strand:- start:3945 stop:4715 length:771 start_codon:yes stop_codon:yes gene_type:complete
MNKAILIIIFLLIIIYYTLHCYKYKNIESFDIKDIGKIGDTVNDFGRTIDSLPKQIDSKVQSIGKEIEKNTLREINDIVDKVNEIPKEVDKKVQKVATDIKDEVEEFFSKKIKSVFTQLGNVFKKGLIDPIFNVFIGIGSIFELIFKILLTLIDKIILLPNCILPYFIGSIEDIFKQIYNSIVPNTIKYIIYNIYSYTIKVFVDMFDNSIGYTKKKKKCYDFDIKKEVSKMNDSFKKIDQGFKKDFGRLDFGSIKI